MQWQFAHPGTVGISYGDANRLLDVLIMDARFRYVLPAERYAAAGGFLKTGYAVD